jgi:geranylgeranyl pyrophosphate synthase
MDGAASRRGIRSANAVWGSRLSVLVGDYLVTRALDMVPLGQREKFLPQLCEVARHMCVGQAEEMRACGRQLAEGRYLQIVRLKTGSLFAFCGRAGAQTADGSAETTAALERFGEAFGVAFQLADDILDFVGCDGRSGKPEGRDLAEHKCTLPLILAAERGGEGVSGRLQRVLSGEQPSAADLQAARELAEATGAVAQAWSKVDEWRRAARRELTAVPPSSARDALGKLCGDGFPMPVMTSAE